MRGRLPVPFAFLSLHGQVTIGSLVYVAYVGTPQFIKTSEKRKANKAVKKRRRPTAASEFGEEPRTRTPVTDKSNVFL